MNDFIQNLSWVKKTKQQAFFLIIIIIIIILALIAISYRYHLRDCGAELSCSLQYPGARYSAMYTVFTFLLDFRERQEVTTMINREFQNSVSGISDFFQEENFQELPGTAVIKAKDQPLLHRIIESQNCLGWKRPTSSPSPTTNLTPTFLH